MVEHWSPLPQAVEVEVDLVPNHDLEVEGEGEPREALVPPEEERDWKIVEGVLEEVEVVVVALC